MSANARNTPESDAELIKRFKHNFALVASVQGRVCYLIMSAHVVHPHFLNCYVSNSTTRLLYFNMVYGIGAMIYARPVMQPIGVFNRISFSLLGSLAFNYGSMAVFRWIRHNYESCAPYLATFLSVFAGRIFMLHLLAFLYHVDRKSDPGLPRNSAYESMYYGNR